MDFANSRMIRITVEADGTTAQLDIDANHLWDAWCDALELLRRHGLDHELPQRTLERMGHRPSRNA